ncbi:MAG: PDZ domain-containing protein [Streptosporangiales bacterium]|nr:PDZ domain-containing protein [Streptosporangiales bacterium]
MSTPTPFPPPQYHEPPPPPPPPPPAQPKRRGALAFVAIAAVAGLVGGGVGAGTVYLVDPGTQAVVSGLPGKDDDAQAPTGDATKAAERVLPSVVSITASGGTSASEGSGFVISSTGHILTNNHVVAGAEQGGELTVTLRSGKQVAAKVVGTDPTTDLAVIKVDGVENLKPVALGDSTSLAVGAPVVAIGSPLRLSGTVTSGIVSALDRPVRTSGSGDSPFGGVERDSAVLDAIQTDAAVNPGNSGGPLVDGNGRVVGINSAIATVGGDQASSQSGNIGVGFAIPIGEAWPIAKELMADGTASHAQLGVQVSDAQEGDAAGGHIATVADGGAAEKAGLRAGDVVTKVGERRIDSADALIAAIRAHRPGDEVTITYRRGGDMHTATVTLDSDD